MRMLSSPAQLVILAVAGFLPACASAPLVQGNGLSSYEAMKSSDGWLTKSRLSVNKEKILAAKTIRIVPTAFAPSVAPKLSSKQRELVANAVNRAMCVSLSDRFTVVAADSPADLTVQASVTQAKETGQVAAGISAAASLGMNFVDTAVPVPTPRIPIGMGSLSIEAEAIDALGQQQASILWARGANAFFSSARVSKVSDAYDLADTFGEDFGQLLVKGTSPFDSSGIELPSWHKIKSSVGLRPKYPACESYGRYRGLKGMISDQLALPPEWTDSGAQKAAPSGEPRDTAPPAPAQ
ncbi:MAG: hypothetical protein H6Q99_2740 [Proteobacteria bacterium]|nr:hypothetical protein [Pseudomonadota bacterium]